MNLDPLNVLDIIQTVAEEEILPRFRQLASHEISEKAPGDIVTLADTEAERRLAEEFRALVPASLVVGEEGVALNPDDLAALDQDGPVWIVDPVDGTQNFADGSPCFAVMAALCLNREPEAAWIYDPINKISVHAVRGQGAWERTPDGDKQLRLPEVGNIGKMTGSLSRRRTTDLNRRRALGEPGIPNLVKRYRSVGREYMDLARGKLHFLRYGGKLKPWDHVPGILIHRELGGYDALADSSNKYPIGSNILSKTIMLAPSPEKWKELANFLDA